VATLATGEALGAGFRVIRRAPAAFGVWIAIEFGVSLVLQLLLGALGATSPSAMVALYPLVLGASLVTSVVITAAVFRAVLTPDDSRGFYVRLGAQELSLGLAFIAVAVLWLVGVIVLMIPAIIVSTIIGMGGSLAMTFLSVVVTWLAMAAIAAWVFLRLSLALPIAYAERKTGIIEAWKLSRGHVLNMLGVWFVILLVMAIVYAFAFGLMFGPALASLPLGNLAQALEDDPALLARSMNPLTAFVGGAGLLVAGGLLRVTFAGAWAHMYRQLTMKPAVDVFT